MKKKRDYLYQKNAQKEEKPPKAYKPTKNCLITETHVSSFKFNSKIKLLANVASNLCH